MNEKTMVSDALVGVNGELKMFGEMIPQTENKELKQCLKQIRSECEMSQEKLYQVAREKSYYVPAAKATREEIDHVKNILTDYSLDRINSGKMLFRIYEQTKDEKYNVEQLVGAGYLSDDRISGKDNGNSTSQNEASRFDTDYLCDAFILIHFV